MNLKHSFKELNQKMQNRAEGFIGRPFEDDTEKEWLTHNQINLQILALLSAIKKLNKKIEKYHKHLDKLEEIEYVYDKKHWQSLSNSKYEKLNVEEEIEKLDKRGSAE